MYLAREHWSEPDEDDPPPCFRQGDVVQLTYVRPDVEAVEKGRGQRFFLELRTEPVVLVSTCCDLVLRPNQKRKGVLVSPLREVPRNIQKDPDALAILRMPLQEVLEKDLPYAAGLAYYAAATVEEAGSSIQESVVHLEALGMVPFQVLASAEKLAEITKAARDELRERIKHHFTRDPRPKASDSA